MAMFRDRTDAGQALAKKLTQYTDHDNVIVLALPRGGVPVAYEVAKYLHAPLDVMLVRKLGVPYQPELAMGAIASGDVRILNEEVVRSLGISEDEIANVVAREKLELERREHAYRGDRAPLQTKDMTVVVIDDGIATGATMRAAVSALQQQHPAHLVVAAPTSAQDTYNLLRDEVDEVVCIATPEPYIAVGLWYEHFDQTTDDEVRQLLKKANTMPLFN